MPAKQKNDDKQASKKAIKFEKYRRPVEYSSAQSSESAAEGCFSAGVDDTGKYDAKVSVSHSLTYSLVGQFLGLICIIGGIVLFLYGVTGSTSWSAKFFGASSSVTDAAPGVVLFIVGLFFVWVTRYKKG